MEAVLLSERDAKLVSMWRSGMDTLAIARELRTEEHVVYNALAHVRSRKAGAP